MSDILNKYFEWLCGLINFRGHSITRYKKLLMFLHDVEFHYSIPRDANRYEDGIDMRYQYGVETNTSQRMIALALDEKPCSMLEMMVALAYRCEQQVMSNAELGNRTGEWFWYMVSSLGLEDQTNKNFDDSYCWAVMNRFFDREYEPNGEGGLFRVDVVDENLHFLDLRNYEIWYQATWYLNSVIEGGQNDFRKN